LQLERRIQAISSTTDGDDSDLTGCHGTPRHSFLRNAPGSIFSARRPRNLPQFSTNSWLRWAIVWRRIRPDGCLLWRPIPSCKHS